MGRSRRWTHALVAIAVVLPSIGVGAWAANAATGTVIGAPVLPTAQTAQTRSATPQNDQLIIERVGNGPHEWAYVIVNPTPHPLKVNATINFRHGFGNGGSCGSRTVNATVPANGQYKLDLSWAPGWFRNCAPSYGRSSITVTGNGWTVTFPPSKPNPNIPTSVQTTVQNQVKRSTPAVTVIKKAQSQTSDKYEPAAGWRFTVNPRPTSGSYRWVEPNKGDGPGSKTRQTGAAGQTRFQWSLDSQVTSNVSVSEQVKSGYTFSRAQCTRRDNGVLSNVSPFRNGTASFNTRTLNIPVGPDSEVTCEYYNNFNYQPGIKLTKTAVDDPVRGNASGWNQIYRFTVTNPGNTTLSNITLSDARCTPGTLKRTGGDTTNDNLLQTDETWTYTCARKIQYATSNQKISDTNQAVVQGVSPNRKIVVDRANKTVDVKTPALSLVKTAALPDGSAIADGQKVAAGTMITYGYVATNVGNDTIRDVQITDDKCSPLKRTAGSGSSLAPGDSWTYTCDARLLPPSTESSVTNVATVSGLWSNPNNKTQNNSRVTASARKTIGVNRAAMITVIKEVNPLPAADQDFDFTITGNGAGVASADAAFTLNPGATPAQFSRQISVTPTPGNNEYVITEGALPSGWTFDEVLCDKTDGVAYNQQSATLSDIAIGDNVTCVFTNQIEPKLTIRKQAVGTDGNPDNSSTFTFSRNGVSDFTLKNGESQVVQPGTEKVNETATSVGDPSDHWSTSISCTGVGAERVTVDMTIADPEVDGSGLLAGDDVTCLFVNTRKDPPEATLTITKHLDPVGSGPAFDFELSGGQSESFSLQPDATGSASKTVTLSPANDPTKYVLSETVTAGWSLKDKGIVCNGATGVPGPTYDFSTATATLHINSGDAVTCQFTNQKNASLTVAKSASFDADASILFPFEWNVPSPKSFSLANGELAGAQVGVGTYQVREQLSSSSVPTDWYLAGDPVCTGTTATPTALPSPNPGVEIQIGTGEDARCVFTNYYDYRPAIQLVKTVDQPVILQGGSATYTYVVTNTGNENIETSDPNSMVTDDKCSSVTRTSGSGNVLAKGPDLATPGESWTFTCTATGITDDTTNVATATMTGVTSKNTVTSTDKAFVEVRKPQVILTKQAKRTLVYTGADVKYVYWLQNSGQTDFDGSGAKRTEWVGDNKCTPLAYKSGDTGKDKTLAVGEIWKFTCTDQIDQKLTNRASAQPTPVLAQTPTPTPDPTQTTTPTPSPTQTGTPTPSPTQTGTPTPTPSPTGTPVKPDKVKQTVKVVKRGGMTVSKSASADKVPSGSYVTYTYRVRNTGDLPLAKVKAWIADDKCAEIYYVSGDSNNNNLLDGKQAGGKSNETWVFECTSRLYQTTTNKVTVYGQPKNGQGKKVGPPVSKSEKKTVTVTGSGGQTPATTGGSIMLGLLTSIVLIASGATLVLVVRERRYLRDS